ncbi:MAG: hypothetical protein MUE33_01325 [Cytophagaceae bacterium]|nr:hypothetical protein [Cytophagaceae bacterium]
MKTLFSTLICFIILIGTSSMVMGKGKPKSKLDYTQKHLYFGNGGGFSGTIQQWVISEKGHLYKLIPTQHAIDSIVWIKKINKSTRKSLFNTFYFIEKTLKTLDEPGNTYYFIRMERSNHNTTYIWNYTTTNTTVLTEFYETLYQLIS